MKAFIDLIIREFVLSYQEKHKTATCWQAPLIAYATAHDPGFMQLKQVVGPGHALPQDLVSDAQTVIAYFVPLAKAITASNLAGQAASRAWALAYIETNQLISGLNQHLLEELQQKGYTGSRIPPTHNFNKVELISDWSHRHAAVIAGLGTWGLNNMLITEKGCAGRVGSLVTNLVIQPSERPEGQFCRFKNDGSCQRCVQRCVNQALRQDSFDRHRCYEMCLSNEELYSELGKADVCGKCLIGVPCSFTNPVRK